MNSKVALPQSRFVRSAPSGLLMPVHATVRGRVRWRVLDERGQPEAPRGPSGVAIAGVGGVEQPNLITNLGLNRMAALNCLSVTTTVTTPGTWRRRLAVGTGSTAPAVGDTTLDAEAQRAMTSGGFPNGSVAYELDTTANEWVAESTVTRLVTMTASRNLTEFGLAHDETGDIIIRELLRDGGGTPITVTLLEGKTLRVDHTLEVRIPAPASGNQASINIEEYDVGDNLSATLPYDITHGGYDTMDNPVGVFTIWNPALVGDSATYAVSSSFAYARTSAPSGFIAASETLMTLEDYVPGSYERIQRATFTTAQANTALYGFRFAGGTIGTAINRGWIIRFDDPATYTKLDTDTLRVGLVSAWARA